jgi:LVIVD repeat
MTKLRTLAALVGAAALALTVATGVAIAHEEEDLAHAVHNPPGNPIAYPLAEDVSYVGGNNTMTGGHVVVEGNRLYVGAYALGMRIFDISNPADPRLIGQWIPGTPRADAVPDAAVFDGRHIATLNGTRRVTATELRTDKTEFLDVTDPANPKLLWTFVGQADGEAHNGDIVDERRLWLASGGLGVNGLRIYDLNPLLGGIPAAPANLFRGDPVKLWEESPYRNGRAVGRPFTHTHDITVYTNTSVAGLGKRDIALLAEGGSYADINGDTGSVFVIDITNPRNPVVLLRWLHERGPGHHPIRYHHEAQLLDGDRRLMLVTDEDMHNGCGNAGGVTAVRLSADFTSAQEVSEWFIPLGTPAPVCSVHVFSSKKKVAFFGSYNAGLQIVDYRNAAAPKRIGQYIAPGATSWGALYHAGYIYVGDMTRGLDVFKYDDPDGLLFEFPLSLD